MTRRGFLARLGAVALVPFGLMRQAIIRTHVNPNLVGEFTECSVLYKRQRVTYGRS